MQVSLLDSYVRGRQEVTTENQVTVLLRDLEHRHTLSELEEFGRDINANLSESRWKEAETFWLDKFDEKRSSFPAHYRTDLRLQHYDEVFQYYSSSRGVSDGFLVCFTGAFGGLMLPNWIVLSLLPENITDVLVIDSKRNLQSPSHVRFQKEWDAISQKYQEIREQTKAKESFVLGVSGGTPAALLFTLEQRINDVMVVGPIKLNPIAFHRVDQKASDLLHARRHRNLRVHFLSGTRDFMALRQIPRLLRRFSRVKVHIVRKSDHSVLAWLFRKQRLTDAFQWLKQK